MPLWVFFFVILTLSISAHCSPSPSKPLRMRRYADAIFTNSYRKILGQLSARKLLQDIMSRQQGEREGNQEQGASVRLGRQVDSMWADEKQTALEGILVALLQKHRKEQVGAAPKLHRLGSKAINSEKDALQGLSVGIPKDEDGSGGLDHL